MSYLYETHLHTVQASACGKSRGADYIPFYKKKGYTGIIVTDHFFNGNTCVPSHLSWEERVELFCKGYEEAKAEARACFGNDEMYIEKQRVTNLVFRSFSHGNAALKAMNSWFMVLTRNGCLRILIFLNGITSHTIRKSRRLADSLSRLIHSVNVIILTELIYIRSNATHGRLPTPVIPPIRTDLPTAMPELIAFP